MSDTEMWTGWNNAFTEICVYLHRSSRVWIIGFVLICRHVYWSQAELAFRLVLLPMSITDFDEDTFIKLAVDISLGGTADVISDLILSQETSII